MAQLDKRFSSPTYDIVSFATDFLNAIGAPTTPANMNAVIGWANAESSGYNPSVAGGRNNPLNIVRTSGDGSSGQGGSQGNIADFPTPQAGLAATVKFFNGPKGDKANIIAAFRTNAGTDAIQAAVAKFYGQWGAGGFKFAGTGLDPGGVTEVTPGNVIGDVASNVPGVSAVTDIFGNVIGGLGLPAQLAGLFIGVFANWRYFLEVMLGLGMTTFGVLLIAHDTGALGAATQAATKGAASAAVAA